MTGASASTSIFATSATAPKIALRRREARQFRHSELGVLGNRIFLERAVRHEDHRTHRRRHRDLIGADRRFAEMLQRSGRIIPFRVVAHDHRPVLHRVIGLDAGAPHGRVGDVGGEHADRHAIAIGVVDRHRCVLQADRRMDEIEDRLAFDLGIALRHRDRDFFVQAGEPFGRGILAVIDEGFLQAAEARARHRGDVFDAQGLPRIDHEIRAAGLLDEVIGACGEALRLGRFVDRGDALRRLGLLGRRRALRHRLERNGDGRGRAGERCTFEEITAADPACVFALRHRSLQWTREFRLIVSDQLPPLVHKAVRHATGALPAGGD